MNWFGVGGEGEGRLGLRVDGISLHHKHRTRDPLTSPTEQLRPSTEAAASLVATYPIHLNCILLLSATFP